MLKFRKGDTVIVNSLAGEAWVGYVGKITKVTHSWGNRYGRASYRLDTTGEGVEFFSYELDRYNSKVKTYNSLQRDEFLVVHLNSTIEIPKNSLDKLNEVLDTLGANGIYKIESVEVRER